MSDVVEGDVGMFNLHTAPGGRLVGGGGIGMFNLHLLWSLEAYNSVRAQRVRLVYSGATWRPRSGIIMGYLSNSYTTEISLRRVYFGGGPSWQ